MKNLLIIDDDVAFGEMLKDYFSDKGFNVLRAFNGAEGIRLAGEIVPDAIFLDVMMPGIHGIEVLRSLQADDITCRIPILILTGSRFEAHVGDIFKQESNCVAFLSKTIAMNKLEEQLQSLLQRNAK
ncbi:MAG: response regulator [bacterium]